MLVISLLSVTAFESLLLCKGVNRENGFPLFFCQNWIKTTSQPSKRHLTQKLRFLEIFTKVIIIISGNKLWKNMETTGKRWLSVVLSVYLVVALSV